MWLIAVGHLMTKISVNVRRAAVCFWFYFFRYLFLFQLDRYEAKVLMRENSMSVSYKTKVARMLFIIVIVFILLHLPFMALILLRNKLLKSSRMDQIDDNFQTLWYAAHYLLYLNAAVNPIIYGLTNDNFRRAYHQTPLLPQCMRYKSSMTIKKMNIEKVYRKPSDKNVWKNMIHFHAIWFSYIFFFTFFLLSQFFANSSSSSSGFIIGFIFLMNFQTVAFNVRQNVRSREMEEHVIAYRPTQFSLLNLSTGPNRNKSNSQSGGNRTKTKWNDFKKFGQQT